MVNSQGAVAVIPRVSTVGAFTLVEILVTMTLLSFIVLGLLMMFNQTQRAFRSGLGQTDVLEGGRGAMDVLVRDLEQMTPCEAADVVSTGIRGQTGQTTVMVNFWAALDTRFPNPNLQYVIPSSGGPAVPRANVMEQFFFLSKVNQDWIANYYRVEPDPPGSAVGSLYHYTWTNSPRYAPRTVGNALYQSHAASSSAILALFSTNRVVDGVIHLRLRVFDPNGVPLTYFPTNSSYPSRNLAASVNPYRQSVTNANSPFQWSFGASTQPDQMDYMFWNNATPAYVELELGILESKVLQHYRAIDPTTAAAQNYLSNHVGQVHIFRQRVPIRNVDFSAYQ